ncbi:MAG: hypothetical protein ACRELY_03920, partial [Polyangiaceae bacterium]
MRNVAARLVIRLAIGALTCAATGACGGSYLLSPPGPTVQMHFDRPTSFYDAPFPSDDSYDGPSGSPYLKFPNPSLIQLVHRAEVLVGQANGFSTSSAVYF